MILKEAQQTYIGLFPYLSHIKNEIFHNSWKCIAFYITLNAERLCFAASSLTPQNNAITISYKLKPIG